MDRTMSNVLQFKKKRDDIELTKAESKVWSILDSSIEDAYKLGEIFDVSHQTVRNIKMLKTERASRIFNLMSTHGIEPKVWDSARRFTAAEVAAIRADTRTSKKIAADYGCSPSTIRMIKTGKTYV